MDNRVFNVNGRSKEQFKATMKLAFLNEYGDMQTAKAWEFIPKKGLVFYWTDSKGDKFPVPVSVEGASEIAWEWLQSDQAKEMEFASWDHDADHDGSNDLGFRVYCEDWGHVAGRWEAIVAVRPAYCWYGK